MAKIGSNHGIEATRKSLHALSDGGTSVDRRGFDRLFGEPGKVYPSQPGPVEGTLQKLVTGHNKHEDEIAALRAEVAAMRPFGAPS